MNQKQQNDIKDHPARLWQGQTGRDENTLTTALFTLEAALSHLAGAMQCRRVVLDLVLDPLLNLEVLSYDPIS